MEVCPPAESEWLSERGRERSSAIVSFRKSFSPSARAQQSGPSTHLPVDPADPSSIVSYRAHDAGAVGAVSDPVFNLLKQNCVGIMPHNLAFLAHQVG